MSSPLAVDLGLISLDQEKAFDRVEHQYLRKTLEAFGLSPSLIAMMKVLYQDVESVLKINGGLSAPFKVQRGIRQGCSLSGQFSRSCTHHTIKKVHNTQEASCPEFKDTRAVAEELSLRSLRYTEVIMQRWTNKLSEDELNLIKGYHDGAETPDKGDPFPELELLPDLNGYEGMYLDAEKGHVLPIYEAKRKDIYKCCVKVINKRKLDRRVDTVWRQELGVLDDIKPVWRVLYKTPLRKRAGDLQWRILHGAVGVNVLISKLNPDVLQTCPFCNGTETVFHCYSGCKRLNPLLELLKTFLICLVRNGL
ncbi:hypothetical protein QTP86_017407, partial [Hemibagrus guttatus]